MTRAAMTAALSSVQLLVVVLTLLSSLSSSTAQELTLLPQGQCADGRPLVQCMISPCSPANNPCKDTEECGTNYCGGCTAVCKPQGINSTVSCPQCPREYAVMKGSVCSSTGTTRDTACDAVCQYNETVAYAGPCNVTVPAGAIGSPSTNSSSDSSSNSTSSHGCVCMTQFDPVCTVQNITRSNQCQAKCLNETVAYRGECVAQGQDSASRPSAVANGTVAAASGPSGSAVVPSPATSAAVAVLPGFASDIVRLVMSTALLLLVL